MSLQNFSGNKSKFIRQSSVIRKNNSIESSNGGLLNKSNFEGHENNKNSNATLKFTSAEKRKVTTSELNPIVRNTIELKYFFEDLRH